VKLDCQRNLDMSVAIGVWAVLVSLVGAGSGWLVATVFSDRAKG